MHLRGDSPFILLVRRLSGTHCVPSTAPGTSGGCESRGGQPGPRDRQCERKFSGWVWTWHCHLERSVLSLGLWREEDAPRGHSGSNHMVMRVKT